MLHVDPVLCHLVATPGIPQTELARMILDFAASRALTCDVRVGGVNQLGCTTPAGWEAALLVLEAAPK